MLSYTFKYISLTLLSSMFPNSVTDFCIRCGAATPLMASHFLLLLLLWVITFSPHELLKNARCPHELPTRPK